MAGRTDDAEFGMVILRATSLEEARAMASADPAVRAGVFLLKEVKFFRVALWNATA
ncbi:MAG: YciI family protein [Candidatus Zixiibacteriota bacterium]